MSKLNFEIGTKVRIGNGYIQEHEFSGFKSGQVITLIEGTFDEDNGLYCYTSTAPSVWNENDEDFDSVYHLFGNKFERFFDCEIID